jgi:ATP-binding cassette subfamily B protein
MGIQRLLPAVQQLYLGVTQIRGGKHSVAAALELLNQSNLQDCAQISKPKTQFNKSIILENVSYSYDALTTSVLEKIDLEISKGRSIGVIGKTGCGKSTLLDILMGLLEPTSGAVYVDGLLIDAGNMPILRSLISHVPQSIFLADSSVGENIAFGVPFEEIDWTRVVNSAVAAQISEEIKTWPNQYSTLVGERGVKLSGGQRQRIGIARAIYRKAPILVLDEATSALDSLTEEAVIKSLMENVENLTVVMVAHRLSTLRYCDQIIEIKDKKIGRIGTYDEVILNERM